MNNGTWDITSKERMKARRMRKCKNCGAERGQACRRKDGMEYTTYVHAVRIQKSTKAKVK